MTRAPSSYKNTTTTIVSATIYHLLQPLTHSNRIKVTSLIYILSRNVTNFITLYCVDLCTNWIISLANQSVPLSTWRATVIKNMTF